MKKNGKYAVLGITSILVVVVLLFSSNHISKNSITESNYAKVETKHVKNFIPTSSDKRQHLRNTFASEEEVNRRLLEIQNSSSAIPRDNFVNELFEICNNHPQIMAIKIHDFGLDDREIAMISQVIVMAWDDKVAALEWVSKKTSGIWQSELLELALAECVIYNKTFALNFLEDVKSNKGLGRDTQNMARRMAIGWSHHDAESALEFACAEYSSSFSESDLGQIYINGYHMNPEKFGSFLESKDSSKGLSHFGSFVGAAKILVAKEEPAEVFEWASSLSGTQKIAAQGGVLSAWLKIDAFRAAEYIESTENFVGDDLCMGSVLADQH